MDNNRFGGYSGVFGLVLEKKAVDVPAEILRLAEERKSARQNKDFAQSDELRNKIEKAGYAIEDLKDNHYILKKN